MNDQKGEIARQEKLILLIIFSVAIFSFVMNGLISSLGKGLWNDEALSVYFAYLTLPELNTVVTSFEFNMGLYYYLLKAWAFLGSSELILRSLSLVFFLPATAIMAYSVYLASNLRAAFIVAILIFSHFFLARYSVEIRGYSLAMLTLAILWLGWYRYTTDRKNNYWLLVYFIAAVLSAYTHLFASLTVLGLGLLGLLHVKQRNEAFLWIGCHIAIGFCWVPLLWLIATKDQGQLQWITSTSPRAILDVMFMYSGAAPQDYPLVRRLLLAAFFLTSIVTLIKFAQEIVNKRVSGTFFVQSISAYQAALYLLLLAIAPIIIIYGISQIKPIFSGRYFVFFAPFFLASSAIVLSRIGMKSSVALAVMFALLMFSSSFAYQDRQSEDWKTISQYINKHCIDNGSVNFAFVEPRSQPSLTFYLEPDCIHKVLPYSLTLQSYLENAEYRIAEIEPEDRGRALFIMKRQASPLTNDLESSYVQRAKNNEMKCTLVSDSVITFHECL